MNLKQELVVAGGLPSEVACRLSILPSIRALDLKRFKLLVPDLNGLVIVCYGRVLEYKEILPTNGAAPRRMILNCHAGGSTFLSEQLAGNLRVHSPTARVVLVGDDWRKSELLKDYVMGVAIKHGRAQAEKVMNYGFGTCKERLMYLRDVVGLDFSQWSKQELASWSGISREMVSRTFSEGGLDGAAAKA